MQKVQNVTFRDLISWRRQLKKEKSIYIVHLKEKVQNIGGM